jgi:hypothetical protein
MSAVNDIKHKLGNYFLKKELQASNGRSKRVVNIKDANSVALLYKVRDEAWHKTIKRYVAHLKEEEGIRKIMAFGYFDGKEAPHYLQSKLEFDFFSKKDLNWMSKPSGLAVNNFVAESYDILIDLSMESYVPLRHVLNRSKAKFKVGLYSEENEKYYDLMISIQNAKSLPHFIEQVNYYLSIINRTADSKTQQA